MTIIAKENRTIQVPELENRKVVEHNDLISSVAKMDKTPLKIFELAVSYIDTKNPPKDNTVNLSKTEIYKFFDVSDNDKHSRFKKAITTLHKQSIFEIREMNEKNSKDKYKKYGQFGYYTDNPDMTINECVEQILKECGAIRK